MSDTTNPVILALVLLLAVANLGALGWLALLQIRLRSQSQLAAEAYSGMEQLQGQANNVALAKMLLRAEAGVAHDFEAAVANVTATFSQAVHTSLEHIAKQMEANANAVLERQTESLTTLSGQAEAQMGTALDELLAGYRETLKRVTEAAAQPLRELNDLVGQQKGALEEAIEAEMKKREARLIARFDAKFADIVSNYLAEVLGNEVDLGAQGPYLFRMLEENKAELRQEIASGA